MAQMAAELGLSREYVSAVVSGNARRRGMAEKTIQRVREHLDRRGYMPSRAASQLRESPKRVVGILHVDSIYSHIVEATHLLAREFAGLCPGSSLEIMVAPEDRLKLAAQELLSRRVTDLVWVHNTSIGEAFRNPAIASYLSNTRMTIYNYPIGSPLGEKELLAQGVNLVGIDRMAETRKLVRFLKRLGHRTVVLPDTPRIDSQQAYYEAFENAGLEVMDCPDPFTVEGIRRVMKDHGVTAACFHGDSPACLALCGLRAAGVRVPEDLTVVGFDGMSRAYNPDLTTMVIPVEKMVAKVRELVEGEETKQCHCFDVELVPGLTHGSPLKRDS